MFNLICRFYATSLGKKVVVAITGLVMLGWLVGHLLGNLQIFAGAGPTVEQTKINAYAHFLESNVPLLWSVRLVMIAAIVLHIVTTIKLTLQNKEAREKQYEEWQPLQSTWMSRMMLVGGLFILAYVIYHLLHLTLGVVHQDAVVDEDLYHTLIQSFQKPLVTAAYVFAQFWLAMHLSHGFQSAFRTLGFSSRPIMKTVRGLSNALAAIICLAFSAIPLAILFGFIS